MFFIFRKFESEADKEFAQKERLHQRAAVHLDERALRAVVELRLKRRGVRIDRFADAYLYVNLNSIRVSEKLRAYSLHVSLRQPTYLARSPARGDDGSATWDTDMVGYASRDVFRKGVERNVAKLIDRFLGDWSTANPKRPASKPKPAKPR